MRHMAQTIVLFFLVLSLQSAHGMYAMHVKKVAGKKALITAGTHGIGLAVAKEFVNRGGTAIVTSRSLENIDKFNKSLENNYKEKIFAVQGELINQETAQSLFERIKEVDDDFDVLVNNAGLWNEVNFLDVNEKEMNDNFNVVKGTFFLTQAVAKHWISKQVRGAIVNIGSAWAERAVMVTPCTPHALQKAALHAMGRSAGVELARYGIRMNTISLGTIGTLEHQNSLSKEFMSMYPMGRIGTYEETANLVVTLADENISGWMTGSVIDFSGGQNASR